MSDRVTTCWLACFVNVLDYEDRSKYSVTYSIKSFFISLIQYIEQNKNDDDAEIICFFHNLKFDGSFICNYLLLNDIPFETFINNLNVWYSITVPFQNYNIVFRDSLKILNFSINTMANIFKAKNPKGKTPLLEFKPEKVLPEWEEYVKTDVEILAKSIKTMYYEEGFTKFTSASEALTEFKKTIKYREYFPVLSKEIDEYCRNAYKGGWSYCNPKYQNKIIRALIDVYDINSMYASKMLYKAMPYGAPLFKQGKPTCDVNKYYIAKVWLDVDLKENFLPTFQTKDIKTAMELGIKPTDYITTTNNELYCFYVTNFDLSLIKKHYIINDIVYDSYYEFNTSKGFFDDYILKYKEQKEKAETAGKKQKAKIMLTSLYGKFGSRVESKQKYIFIDEKGVNKFRDSDIEEVSPNYVPLACFITSISRHDIITDAQNNYDVFLYSDTDSLHLLRTSKSIDLQIDKAKFGYWKLEGTFQKAKYLRSKLYMERFYNPVKTYKKVIKKPLSIKFKKLGIKLSLTKKHLIEGKIMPRRIKNFKKHNVKNFKLKKLSTTQIKGAGMTGDIKKQVTFNNFEFGMKYTGKKATKQVKGGMIIYDTDFTIKAQTIFG